MHKLLTFCHVKDIGLELKLGVQLIAHPVGKVMYIYMQIFIDACVSGSYCLASL